ncbi:MAG: hypothetical protein LAP87_09285 [Acidobacteriia bacterium]|nr:hypothetical protein [Terriglobia bacterium]
MCGAAWGQAPAYSAASILNASDYTAGPFAPNSVLSIFGTNLAWQDPGPNSSVTIPLPTRLNGVQVLVDNVPAPLFYVSRTQINFLVPGNEFVDGTPIPVQVVRQGDIAPGPRPTITLVDTAPALFKTDSGYVLALHPDYTVVTPDAPARAGEVVAVFATGLGKTGGDPIPGEAPVIALIKAWQDLKVYLNGALLDIGNIKYAGTAPGWPGLYQINIQLPGNLAPDPEIRVAIGAQSTPSGGFRLAVQ